MFEFDLKIQKIKNKDTSLLVKYEQDEKPSIQGFNKTCKLKKKEENI